MQPPKGHVVVVDDDQEMRDLINDFLSNEGYRVTRFPLATEALQALKSGGSLGPDTSEEVDVIISDIKMAQMDGMEFLQKIRKERSEVPVILITAFGSVDNAIEAMHHGAYHYVVKPFKLAEMRAVLERAVERHRLTRDNQILRNEVKRTHQQGYGIIGKGSAMRAIFDLIGRVSHSTANVLINGESGSGKEVVARAIHQSGPRAAKPFIAINCTAIPETLLESELFGHAKGSFTGAIQRKRGLFEEANGGTLFLDEIGDMSPSLQAKLLRVLQERKIRPVGDNHFYDVDVRIIAATHKDLRAAIRQSLFREDLFYRLSVIPIVIPPLRERQEDIPLLAEHFLRKFTASNASKVQGFTKQAVSKLMRMRWEGNVRELENLIERAVVLAQSDYIDELDIIDPTSANPEEFFKSATGDFPTLDQLEQRYIRTVLDRTGGRKDKAAQILGINRRTLYRKEREYGWVTDELPEEHHLSETDHSRDSDES